MEDKIIIKYIDEANQLLKNSYSVYSHFPVAAILIDSEGNKYRGVNVENASYGLSLCAERNAITTGITDGMKIIDTIIITANMDRPVSPCGACRQVIAEFANKNTKIILANNKNYEYIVWTLEDMIPRSFGPSDL